MTTFRWGLLGAARIARALIPAIREAGGEVAALGVRDPASERARAFAQEWNVPLVGDYDAVIGSDVDAVYNPLPNDAHRPWTRRALEAGKHALTEKPLTLNAAEAQELEGVAAQTGRVLLEAFAYRFQPHVARLGEIVHGGELGEVRGIHGAFGFPLTRPDDFRWTAAQGGGALYDVGTYPVNLIRRLLGKPHSVTAQARWTAPDGVDVGLSGTLHYGQALASLDCAFDWGETATQRFTVVGTRGSLDMDGVFGSHTAQPLTLRVKVGADERQEVFPRFNAYAAMVAHFQRVARGEEAPLYPPADAVAQMRVLDALYAAARGGSPVKLTAER